jgi:hypothetical protein
MRMTVMSMFCGLIGKHLGNGLRVGEVGEAGNGTEDLKEYAEGGVSVGAASADILWPPRRGLLHLRCQKQTWAVGEWAGGELNGVLPMKSSLASHSS